MKFFLGTHRPNWLADSRFASVPLFVSRRTLAPMRKLPRALGGWAMDSGGFTELSMHGKWTLTAAEYVSDVRRIRDEVGELQWAAPQDWMCEPVMLSSTGLTVDEHQRRTVDNLLELRALAPDLPFAPVLQGWRMADYWRCEERYADAGVDLAAEPIVGVGTVCRRQGTSEAERIMRSLAAGGLRLHGFGFKTKGLVGCGDALASADSLAWSYSARKSEPLPGHSERHKNCANCADYALQWRARLLELLAVDGGQVEMFGGVAA